MISYEGQRKCRKLEEFINKKEGDTKDDGEHKSPKGKLDHGGTKKA